MSAHPGIEKEYALDFFSPVRYVAHTLGRASALSSELERGYEHANLGDLARVRNYEGLDSDAEANAFLVRAALVALKDQVAQDEIDGPWRLTRPVEDVRYERKKLATLVNEHAVWRNPFDPMSGAFSANMRRMGGNPAMDAELRESLETFGWLDELPALVDERGTVLVGHRRIALAAELGIDPVTKVVRCGSGDEGDAKRLGYALASNLGSKPLTPGDRKNIAEVLYGDHEWTMERIAEMLKVSKSTIGNDLAGFPTTGKPRRPKGGRPKGTSHKRGVVRDPAVRARYRKLIEQGKSNDEINATLGIAEATRYSLGAAVEIEDEALGSQTAVVADDFEASLAAFEAVWGEERIRRHYCGG